MRYCANAIPWLEKEKAALLLTEYDTPCSIHSFSPSHLTHSLSLTHPSTSPPRYQDHPNLDHTAKSSVEHVQIQRFTGTLYTYGTAIQMVLIMAFTVFCSLPTLPPSTSYPPLSSIPCGSTFTMHAVTLSSAADSTDRMCTCSLCIPSKFGQCMSLLWAEGRCIIL